MCYFVGIAARIGAISVYMSFFINTLSSITWKQIDETKFENVTIVDSWSATNVVLDHSNNNTYIMIDRSTASTKMHSLWLLWDLVYRVLITTFWLFFLVDKTAGKEDREDFWKRKLKLFFTLVFVNLFTFFPPSVTDAHVIRSSELTTEKEKKKNLARFSFFFFLFYLVCK